MIKKLILSSVILSIVLIKNSYANNLDDSKEDVYLKQIYNQLDAIQPFIMAAQKAQLKNQRIQFHYTKYKDNQGNWHNGLLEDIQTEVSKQVPKPSECHFRKYQRSDLKDFKKIRNPELQLYVYPHFAGLEQMPVPGYFTGFTVNQKVYYETE